MSDLDKKDIQERDTKEKKKFKVYLYVALISGAIFIIWLFILPYTLSKIIGNNGNDNQFKEATEETVEILDEIKGAIKILGEQIESTTKTTSTNESATSTDENIEKLKEKILESQN